MSLIKPRINNLFRKKVEGLINDLGKRYKVFVVTDLKTRCPNCVFDGTSQAGSGVYNETGPTPFEKVCPVCLNKGNVITEKKQPLVANVRIGANSQGDKPMAGGDIPEGQASLKTFDRFVNLLAGAKYFLIDGVRYVRLSDKGRPNERGLLTKVVASVMLRRED